MIMKSEATDSKTRLGMIRFLLCSAIGIFVFFVRIPVGESTGIPVDHLITLLKSFLKENYTYIILVLAGYSVVRRILVKDARKTGTDIFFFVQAILGFILCILKVLGRLPQNLQAMAQSAIDATGNILCAIFLTALFIPFLTEYGLVDFVGVLCRPFMRRLFHTPGSSAVIGVSAFLGNYSMGHVISRQMYDEGRFTEREAVIVATGFSTCSIGLMINLVNYLGLMDYWGFYVCSVLLVTFLTTMITARIYPIWRIKETYREGIKPALESEEQHGRWSRALNEGVSKASGAPTLWRSVCAILRRIFPILCEITGTSVFVIPLGMYLAEYTNLFSILGSPFRLLLQLLGINGTEAAYGARALGISILEPVLAGVISEGALSSMIAKWIVAVVPYSAIIFFAGFIPSLLKSGIPCKIYELLLVWLERVVIGVVLSALLAYLLLYIGIFH